MAIAEEVVENGMVILNSVIHKNICMRENLPVSPDGAKDAALPPRGEAENKNSKMKVENVDFLDGKITKITKVFNSGFSRPWMVNLKGEIKWVLLNGNLIIGDINDHIDMVQGVVSPADRDHSGTEAWGKIRSSYGHQVTAAGICNKEGEIVGWKSDGFEVTTPEADRDGLKKIIKKAVLEEDSWKKETE